MHTINEWYTNRVRFPSLARVMVTETGSAPDTALSTQSSQQMKRHMRMNIIMTGPALVKEAGHMMFAVLYSRSDKKQRQKYKSKRKERSVNPTTRQDGNRRPGAVIQKRVLITGQVPVCLGNGSIIPIYLVNEFTHYLGYHKRVFCHCFALIWIYAHDQSQSLDVITVLDNSITRVLSG